MFSIKEGDLSGSSVLIDFVNDVLNVWEIFVSGFLFSYQIGGVQLGYIILAVIVFTVIIRYVLGVIK